MLIAHFGEFVVFCQEAVARVDGIGTARGGGGKDVGNVEIALVALRFADANGFISQLNVQGVFVDRAVHSNGGDAELSAAPQNSKSDLAAVGDQHFADGHPAVSLGLKPDRISGN
jgi:hypothetical protein